MRPGYVLSPAAQKDIDEIWDYTALRWGRVQANRYVGKIRAALTDLADDMRQARAVDVRPGYRHYRVGSHVLFLRDHEQAAFEVVRILHQSMDLRRHLR